MEGQLKAMFDFINHYHLPGIDDTRINYISYRQDIMANRNIHKYQTLVKLAGYVPYKGDEIPWGKHTLFCKQHLLLTLPIIATVITSRRPWPKIKYDEHKV